MRTMREIVSSIDQQRTMREIISSMSSILEFIQFEGEISEMFGDSKLPTLDTKIWLCEETNTVKYSFYEKPTCPNRVIQKSTALNESSIRATLVQEVVRRMKNCSEDLSTEEKQEILSVLAQKMFNSGHFISSIQYLLVHGVVKFGELLRVSKLDVSDEKYKPLYCERNYNVLNRKLHKILARTNWYEESTLVKKTKWREFLPPGWSGSKPAQYSVDCFKYTTLMQVPSSRDSRLFNMLAKAEPRLCKLTGYQVKYSEKSGRPLSKQFPVPMSSKLCFREGCDVCKTHTGKGPSLCQIKSVVIRVFALSVINLTRKIQSQLIEVFMLVRLPGRLQKELMSTRKV